MAPIESVFYDTSILIGGIIDFGDSSLQSMRILDLLASGTLPQGLTAWHCCLEFYSVVTRLPEEYRLEPAAAFGLIETEILSRFRVGGFDLGQSASFFEQAVAHAIKGGRIYDYHIGSIALQMGASILVTENKRHFSPFQEQGLAIHTARSFMNRS